MRIRVQNPDFQLGNPEFQQGQVEILENYSMNLTLKDEAARPPMLNEGMRL